jgi:hypothetical protein
MKHYAFQEVSVDKVEVLKEKILANIRLIHRGVFMVSISTDSGDLVHKRFVQLETGENKLEMPLQGLNKGQYVLTLLKGNNLVKQRFAC